MDKEKLARPILKFCPLCKHYLHKKKIDSKKRLVCKSCGWIYYDNPLPVAVSAVRNKNGELFVAKRNIEPGKNRWALPGGFIESNESPEKACLRELKEETGLRGRIKRFIGVYIQNTLYYGSVLVIAYEVIVFKKKILLNGELKEGKFFGRKDVPNIPFSSHRKIVDEFFKKRQN